MCSDYVALYGLYEGVVLYSYWYLNRIYFSYWLFKENIYRIILYWHFFVFLMFVPRVYVKTLCWAFS